MNSEAFKLLKRRLVKHAKRHIERKSFEEYIKIQNPIPRTWLDYTLREAEKYLFGLISKKQLVKNLCEQCKLNNFQVINLIRYTENMKKSIIPKKLVTKLMKQADQIEQDIQSGKITFMAEQLSSLLGDTFINYKKMAPIYQWQRIVEILQKNGFMITKDHAGKWKDPDTLYYSQREADLEVSDDIYGVQDAL